MVVDSRSPHSRRERTFVVARLIAWAVDNPLVALLFAAVLAAGGDIVACPLDGDWIDVGVPEQLRAAREGSS